MQEEQEIKRLSDQLLTAENQEVSLRINAAQELASYWLSVRAFNALYSICAFPDRCAVEGGLVPVAARALGQILSKRDLAADPLKHYALDAKHFQALHPEALMPALEALTPDQQGVLYQHVLKNPFSSEGLTGYFYAYAYRNALRFDGDQQVQAIAEAKKGILLFQRCKRERKTFDDFLEHIVFAIIAQKRGDEIYAAFLELLKNYGFFEPPRIPFETYARYQVMLLAKLVCRDMSGMESLFHQLSVWTLENRPEDKRYLEIFQLILEQRHPEATQAVNAAKRELKQSSLMGDQELFYLSWCLIAAWILLQTRF